jgi:hypothetical protein
MILQNIDLISLIMQHPIISSIVGLFLFVVVTIALQDDI